jgi:RNA polymerase sigma-70 factor (ECF subfamily)
MSALAKAFTAALAGAREVGLAEPELQRWLERALEEAAERHAGAEIPANDAVRHLARVWARPENAHRALGALHTEDLYLALACSRGDRHAIERCDHMLDAVVRRTLGARAGDDVVDDLRQDLREALHLSHDGADPLILSYSGTGKLASWLGVVASRRALKHLRGRQPEPLDSRLLRLVERESLQRTSGPEQAHMAARYHAEFVEALRRSAATLPERDREVLKLYFVEGRTVQQLGAALGVHHATAARWVQRAKESLVAGLRRLMMEKLQVGSSTCDSVLALIGHDWQDSIRALLSRSETDDDASSS